MEKKEIKISLGTVICICIIVILLAVIGIMYLKMKNIDSKNTAIKQEEIKEQVKEDKFKESEEFYDLNEENQKLLNEQYDIMVKYLTILEKRFELNK